MHCAKDRVQLLQVQGKAAGPISPKKIAIAAMRTFAENTDGQVTLPIKKNAHFIFEGRHKMQELRNTILLSLQA